MDSPALHGDNRSHRDPPRTHHQETKGHGGELAVAVARAHGVETMFTLSGAHVFPMYDGAVKADPPMRLLDVRHEQTAAFAAEATGKLTRVPGLAVLTAGTGRHQRGLRDRPGAVRRLAHGGGRRARTGAAGAAARCRSSTTRRSSRRSPSWPGRSRRPPTSRRRRRGVHGGGGRPTAARRSSTCRWTSSSTPRHVRRPAGARKPRREPDPDESPRSPALLAAARRPVLVLGTDVWADGAEEAALRFVRGLGMPVVANGMGRGLVPGGDPLLVTKARGAALGGADLVVVAGTPLDFRLGYGVFGGKDGAQGAVVHVADSPGQVATHAELAASAAGDLPRCSTACWRASSRPRQPDWSAGRRAAGGRRRGRRARRRLLAPTPTRSTRRASTASWCHASPTTRW